MRHIRGHQGSWSRSTPVQIVDDVDHVSRVHRPITGCISDLENKEAKVFCLN